MGGYYITGGMQERHHAVLSGDRFLYEAGVLAYLDTDTGELRQVFKYRAPDAIMPTVGGAHIFKAASWDGPNLLLCGLTEVLIFDPVAEKVIHRLTHPWMNDVHHVERIDGRIHVASTGVDAILVFDEDDKELVECVGVLPDAPWGYLDRTVDYRLVASTQPHRAHPNFVTKVGGARWVSRPRQRELWCMDTPDRAIRIAENKIHDIIPADGLAWCTVVEGQLVGVDLEAGKVVERLVLPNDDPHGIPLGWCRSLVVEPERFLVGFSRLRRTTLRENLAWVRSSLGGKKSAQPTRIVAFNRQGTRELESWRVDGVGLDAVFSILPATPPSSTATG